MRLVHELKWYWNTHLDGFQRLYCFAVSVGCIYNIMLKLNCFNYISNSILDTTSRDGAFGNF